MTRRSDRTNRKWQQSKACVWQSSATRGQCASRVACLHLQVVLRVPVRVEDDAGVGRRQVNAQAARSGAQQEDEALRVGFAEAVDGGLPQVPSHAAVDPLVQVPARERGGRGER